MLPIYRYIINYLRMWQSLHFTFDEHLNIYFYDDAFDFVKTRRTDMIVYNIRDFSVNFNFLKLWRNRGGNCQNETLFIFEQIQVWTYRCQLVQKISMVCDVIEVSWILYFTNIYSLGTGCTLLSLNIEHNLIYLFLLFK